MKITTRAIISAVSAIMQMAGGNPGKAERDVFVERSADARQVLRASKAGCDLAQPVYALANSRKYSPFDAKAPKGRKPGMPLGE